MSQKDLDLTQAAVFLLYPFLSLPSTEQLILTESCTSFIPVLIDYILEEEGKKEGKGGGGGGLGWLTVDRNDILLRDTIGSGATSDVKVGEWRRGGGEEVEVVAAKVVWGGLEEFRTEV